MVFALALGFAAVAGSGVLLFYRGRRVAAACLCGALAAGIAVVALSVGREGVSDLALGSLVGLPVLLGCIAARDRRERSPQR